MGIIATTDKNELIEELYRQKNYQKVRKLLFEFYQSKVQGLMSDDNYEFLYLFNRPLKIGLHKIADTILSESKRVNKNLLIDKYLMYIKSIKNEIQLKIGSNKINEINNLEVEIVDKIKVMLEDNKLSIFPDNLERIEKIKDNIIKSLNLKNITYIKNIGAIIGNLDNNDFDNILKVIKNNFDENSIIFVTKKEENFFEGYITFE